MIVFVLTFLAALTVQVGQSVEGVQLVLINESGVVVDQLDAPRPGRYTFGEVEDGSYTLRAVLDDTVVASVLNIRLPMTETVEISVTEEAASRAAEAREQAAGSQRNENIQVNLIDNDALTEQLGRSGAEVSPITEFSAVRANYAAEFGGLGANIQILRPDRQGAYHGEVYEYLQNSVFNARTFFQVGDVEPTRRNQYGFKIGGPLLGDRLSFVLTGEEIRQAGAVNGNVLVPLASERAPRTDDPDIRRLVDRWLAAYPTQLPNRVEIDPRMLNTNTNQTIRNSGGSFRLDWQVAPDHTFSLRYSLSDVFIDSFEFVDGLNPNQSLRPQNLNISTTSNISPGTTLKLGVNYLRRKIHLLVPPAAVGPMVTIARQIENLGPFGQFPIRRVRNDFEYLVQGTTTAGNHQIDWGAEVRRYQMNDLQSDNARGIFNFRPNFGRTAVENLLWGTPSRYEQSLGGLYRGFRNTDVNFFLNDRYRLSPGLDLTVGLRYEFAGAPAEINNLTEFPYESDANNVAPRLGFAYRAGETVVRGGYGIAFGRVFPATFQWARFNPPAVIRVSVQSPDILDPLNGLQASGSDETVRSGLNVLDPELVAPYSQHYTLELERDLPASMRVTAAYVGSRTWKLFQTVHSNRSGRLEGVPLTTGTINDRRPDQRFFAVNTITNMGRAYFDAGQLTLDKSFDSGLSMRATYTLSKAIDTGPDFSSTAVNNDERRSQLEDDVIADLKGPSNFDSRHSFVLGYRWELPGAWLRGWAVSGTALFRSGTPFTVETGTDAPPHGNVDSVRQDRPAILDASLLGRSIDDPDTSLGILTRSAFSTGATFDSGRGNLGRNTFRKDGTSNLNLAVSKVFYLSSDQSRSLTLRTEITNLTNHPQFAEPNIAVTSPSFGRITNTLNGGRIIQFALAIRF